ncbi:hypothetical protein [Halococcus thailandensis]|nr:hypothetical protein [Halococcus thailandensis]
MTHDLRLDDPDPEPEAAVEFPDDRRLVFPPAPALVFVFVTFADWVVF